MLIKFLSSVSIEANITIILAFSNIFFIYSELFEEGFCDDGAGISDNLKLSRMSVHNFKTGVKRLSDNLIQVDRALVKVKDFWGGSLESL